jgi:hypothetical protein
VVQIRSGITQNYDGLMLGLIAEKQLVRQGYEQAP